MQTGHELEPTPMEKRIQDFVNRRVWAVVGVSEDAAKYGHRIFRNLRGAGYVVYGVNPKGGQVDGQPLYPSLADLPATVEVVDIVVPPQVTEQVVQEAHRLGLNRVWMQPGSESAAAIAWAEAHGMEVVHDACAMVNKKRWNG
jgi:predicted CoA-binding protein